MDLVLSRLMMLMKATSGTSGRVAGKRSDCSWMMLQSKVLHISSIALGMDFSKDLWFGRPMPSDRGKW